MEAGESCISLFFRFSVSRPYSNRAETSHLGLTRSSSDENKINLEERIALARRTLYSLIKTGVHNRLYLMKIIDML
jgi:hypothetical protein